VTEYRIREVAASRDRTIAAVLHGFNALAPETFPPLEPRHMERGHWWIAYHLGVPAAFAGIVPFEGFPGVGYLKRAYVMPKHRGRGLQRSLLEVREAKARHIGWTLLVSECSADNVFSARNFQRAGYTQFDPEQRWGAPNSVYWKKDLAA
jgi:GNAT superfamily N-acetyltransferase